MKLARASSPPLSRERLREPVTVERVGEDCSAATDAQPWSSEAASALTGHSVRGTQRASQQQQPAPRTAIVRARRNGPVSLKTAWCQQHAPRAVAA